MAEFTPPPLPDWLTIEREYDGDHAASVKAIAHLMANPMPDTTPASVASVEVSPDADVVRDGGPSLNGSHPIALDSEPTPRSAGGIASGAAVTPPTAALHRKARAS